MTGVVGHLADEPVLRGMSWKAPHNLTGLSPAKSALPTARTQIRWPSARTRGSSRSHPSRLRSPLDGCRDDGARSGLIEVDRAIEGRLILRRDTVDSACLGGPHQAAGFEVELPSPDAGHFAGAVQEGFALAQGLVPPLALGDVEVGAEHPFRLPVRCAGEHATAVEDPDPMALR